MLTPKLQMLERTLKRLLRRGAAGPLERVLVKTHAADLAFIFTSFSHNERVQLIEHCADDEMRGDVLASAEHAISAEVLASLPRQRAAELMGEIEPDDVSDLLEHMEEKEAAELLALMQGEEREEVEELSRYESTTAGGIMSPRFFALDRDKTVREAIAALQAVDTELEMVFYVYVVNELEQLLGVLSLRQLVVNKPDTKLFDVMTSDVISVSTHVDQEEVAQLASRYGLLAVPVVDDTNKLLGIVTVDDVIDVLREEATEDILRMAGAGDEIGDQRKVLRSVLSRFPWLLATGIGGAASAALLSLYTAPLTNYLPLVFFIPLVLGLAGVTGIQSATIVVTIVAQGRGRSVLLATVARQTIVGTLLGLVLGSMVGSFAGWWWDPLQATSLFASLAIGLGIAAAMSAAALLGCLLPWIFSRLRIDPALAAGPFAAMAVDVVGLALYLVIGANLT
ncbi:MAG: magnesium transporter [Myxococcales bacterium]|nr:magnesium transporter [Myxococcales bacterium]